MNELDPEARHMLALAHAARTPTAADKARVERRLAAVLGASAALATAGGLGTAQAAGQIKTAGALAALKWWLGGGALLAAVAGGYWTLASVNAPAAPIRASALQPSAATSAPVRVPALQAPPAAAAPQDAASKPSPPAPKPELPVRPNHSSDLVRELELLHAAQAAWRGAEPARALATVEQHQRRYPHSELAQEREALHVLILCELGRVTEAKKRAHRLLERAPQLPLRAARSRTARPMSETAP
jgi:hypothetical protein